MIENGIVVSKKNDFGLLGKILQSSNTNFLIKYVHMAYYYTRKCTLFYKNNFIRISRFKFGLEIFPKTTKN